MGLTHRRYWRKHIGLGLALLSCGVVILFATFRPILELPIPYIHPPYWPSRFLMEQRNNNYALGHVTLALIVVVQLWWEKRRGVRESADYWHTSTRHPLFLWGCFIFALATFILLKVTQHYSFRTGIYDLSLYHDTLGNTANGQWMYSSFLGRSFFSEHFAPILLLLVPFYQLFNLNTTFLVVAQAVIAVTATIPLYLLAQKLFHHSPLSLLFCYLYLQYNPLHNAVLFDFHMEVFEPFLILSAFLAWHQQKWGRYTLFFLLALSCKEDIALYFFCIGGYFFLFHRQYRLGFFTMALSLAWFFIAMQWIIPCSYPDPSFAQQSRFLTERWGEYGDSLGEIMLHLLRSPQLLFHEQLTFNLFYFFAPFGFIALLSPAFLLPLVVILINGTSSFDLQQLLVDHYAFPAIPLIFISGLYGLQFLLKRWPSHRFSIIALFAVWSIGVSAEEFTFYPITKQDQIGHALVKTIPQTATIAVQTSLHPHFSRHQTVFMYPDGEPESEYIFLDNARFHWPMTDEAYAIEWQKLSTSPDYQLIYRDERYLLVKNRNQVEKAQPNQPYIPFSCWPLTQ